MDILFLLIPMSSVLVLGIVGVFAWALHRGQFEDIDFEGERILLDESQAGAASRNQESIRIEQEVSQWQR